MDDFTKGIHAHEGPQRFTSRCFVMDGGKVVSVNEKKERKVAYQKDDDKRGVVREDMELFENSIQGRNR